MLRKMIFWLKTPNVTVYVATKMTGRDKHDMVGRAEYVISVLKTYGVKGISPVIEEKVKDETVKLINHDRTQLKTFWARDKYIIRRIAHVVLVDQAENKSFGMEREYALNRYCLWKPTVLVLSQEIPSSVVEFEDDAVFSSIHAAGAFISANWGTPCQRLVWRLKMLVRSFPKWLTDQVYAFR